MLLIIQKSLSSDSKVDSRVSNVSPPPGFPQRPAAETMWSNRAFLSRTDSEVFPPIDNIQGLTSPYITTSLPLTSSSTTQGLFDETMFNAMTVFPRNGLDCASVPPPSATGFLSPELLRLLAELDISEGAESVPLGRYKTELCRPYEEHGMCKYGDKCQFAHGRQELRSLSRHPKYKTDLCKTYHTTGLCPYGPRCHFIHNDEEAAFNRAGLERQKRERAIRERIQVVIQQQQHQQQKQQQFLAQQQQLIAAAMLENIERSKVALYSSPPLKSSDFFLNQYSCFDGMSIGSAYDSLDSCANNKSSPSSISDDSIVSSPTFSMLSADEVNNSLNSATSLNGQPSCTSLDSVCADSPTLTTSLHSLSNSQTPATSYGQTTSTTYSNSSSKLAPSFNRPPLSKDQATPGYGRVSSLPFNYESMINKSVSKPTSESLDFIRSEAGQQEIFRLALHLARSLTTSASSACGDRRLLFQQLLPEGGIAL